MKIILKSDLHRELVELPFAIPAEWEEQYQVVIVLTGGSEGLFLQEVQAGHIDLNRPILLVAGLQSNALPASLEILAWINSHNGHGLVTTTAELPQHSHQISTIHPLVYTPETEPLRLGVIGQPSDWLISSRVDYTMVLSKFHIELVDIPLDSIIALGEVDSGLEGAKAIHRELVRMVEQYHLSGLTLRCFDLLTTVKNTGCWALSMLNDAGIPAACEGDIPLLLTMMLARQRYHAPGFQVNPARIYPDGRILFAHCTLPLSMTTKYSLTTHFESGIGVGIHGELPLGEYRLMKISSDLQTMMDEPVRLILNQFEPTLCRTQVWVQASRELAQQMLTHPLANHHLLVKC